mmetsp:Transcript_3374/g.15937  ORF Transcript_3374/g.15937 Transcript_3374/m.15937 type:complete len:86 (-) Transcript_3374:535-792(-)
MRCLHALIRMDSASRAGKDSSIQRSSSNCDPRARCLSAVLEKRENYHSDVLRLASASRIISWSLIGLRVLTGRVLLLRDLKTLRF